MSNEKIEKSVVINPALEAQHHAFPYAINTHLFYDKKTTDEDKKKALLDIKNAFIQYLDDIKTLDKEKGTADFPTLQYKSLEDKKRSVSKIDDRIAIFVALLDIIAKNQVPLPIKFGGFKLHFNVPGWPVSDADPYFTCWAAFIQTATAVFKVAMPNSDLSSWLPEENQLKKAGTSEPVKTPKTIKSILKKPLSEEEITPKPEITSTPKPEITSTPEPEITSTPEPEITSTPIVAPNPEIVNASVKKYEFDGKGWAKRKLNSLLAQLKDMHQYGLQLESEAPEKSIAVMELSISLYEDLKKYYQNKLRPTAQEKQQFLDNFHLKLHSKDELMSTHRKQWKVIIANIAIALTGIGLLAIGISLLARGHAFFNETKCQKLINDTDEKLNNTISVKS